MIYLVLIFIALYLFYLLFFEGKIWPLLLVSLSFISGKYMIEHFFPITTKSIATFLSYNISYASFISFCIVIMGVSYFIKENE